MKHLFDFDIGSTTAEIKLAFEYTPKILENKISKRPYTGLLYIIKGQYEYSFNKTGFIAGEGSLIYLPPHSIPYSYSVFESSRTMQIEIDFKSDNKCMNFAYSSHPVLLSENAFTAYNSFKAVIDGFTKKDTSSKLTLHSNLFSLFCMCSKFSADKDYTLIKKITPAISYIQENYTKPFTVKKLSELCFISESQLRRLFSKLLGKSPLEYKKEIILNSAKSLLESSEFSVGEIADMLGFYDIYAFSHFFSNSVGKSPNAYKKQAERF